jgi:hypothetical protein
VGACDAGGEGLAQVAVDDVEWIKGVEVGAGPEQTPWGKGGLLVIRIGESGLIPRGVPCIVGRGPFPRSGVISADLTIFPCSEEYEALGSASRSCGFRTGAGKGVGVR